MPLSIKEQLAQLRAVEPQLDIGNVVLTPDEDDPETQLDNTEVLRAQLEMLKAEVTNSVNVRQVIEEVYKLMQMHPGLSSLLKPEDYGALVRHLRSLRANRIALATAKSERRAAKKERGIDESFVADVVDNLELD